MRHSDQASPELEGVEVHGHTRASFMLRGTIAAGAVMGAGAVGPLVTRAFAATSSSDIDILNFALTLEYLKTDFYTNKAKTVGLTGAAKKARRDDRRAGSGARRGADQRDQSRGWHPGQAADVRVPRHQPEELPEACLRAGEYGVGAYNGAGPSLKNPAYLAAAGSIVQIEARHAASIAVLIGQKVTPHGGFDIPLSKAKVLAAAGPLIKA